MSLFGDDRYSWRETYFIYFDESNRPSADTIESFLKELGARYEVTEVRTDEEGRFESATVLAPDDYAGMDITYVGGEEVAEQLEEVTEEIGKSTLNAGQLDKLKKLSQANARFDIFHFEQIARDGDFEEDEMEMMDPGALLIVLERLARLCDGVGYDPQSGALM